MNFFFRLEVISVGQSFELRQTKICFKDDLNQTIHKLSIYIIFNLNQDKKEKQVYYRIIICINKYQETISKKENSIMLLENKKIHTL